MNNGDILFLNPNSPPLTMADLDAAGVILLEDRVGNITVLKSDPGAKMEDRRSAGAGRAASSVCSKAGYAPNEPNVGSKPAPSTRTVDEGKLYRGKRYTLNGLAQRLERIARDYDIEGGHMISSMVDDAAQDWLDQTRQNRNAVVVELSHTKAKELIWAASRDLSPGSSIQSAVKILQDALERSKKADRRRANDE